MEPELEARVDGARSAANRVRAALERAKAIKKESMQINEQDEWTRFKRRGDLLQKAKEVGSDEFAAYKEVSECWSAVSRMTMPHAHVDPSAALAQRVVDCDYRQANHDINEISWLVDEVEQNCTGVRQHLR